MSLSSVAHQLHDLKHGGKRDAAEGYENMKGDLGLQSQKSEKEENEERMSLSKTQTHEASSGEGESSEQGSKHKRIHPSYAGRNLRQGLTLPKFNLPKNGIDAATARRIIADELELDGNPTLNLASFVTTWMDEDCDKLINSNMMKNVADQEQYSHSMDIQDRCINILGKLWNAPAAMHSDNLDTHEEKVIEDPAKAGKLPVGTATIGSSEAIMLAGLALKWQWRKKKLSQRSGTDQRIAALEKITDRPNLIFSSAVHVSVLKTCRFLDIEAKVVPIQPGKYTLDIPKVISMIDDNTCGIITILGNTLTGHFDDVQALDEALSKYFQDTKRYIPIHVDGASGAFIAPFAYTSLIWDFRLEHVRSINTSGHKFGLVYPGLGWIVWKTSSDLPSELIFHVNYLGVDEPTFSLNFSKPASNIIAQYFNFLLLGQEGYTKITKQCLTNANFLAESLKATDLFEVISANGDSNNETPCVPLVAVRLKHENLGFNEIDLAKALRKTGWIVPAYTLAADAQKIMVLRIVVRESFSFAMVELLVIDLAVTLKELLEQHGHQNLKQKLHLHMQDRSITQQLPRHQRSRRSQWQIARSEVTGSLAKHPQAQDSKPPHKHPETAETHTADMTRHVVC